MNTLRSLKYMERLHKLIKSNHSGDSLDLSMALGLSRRTVQNYLQELRDLGAIISYDSLRRTYYYENKFDFKFIFEVNVGL